MIVKIDEPLTELMTNTDFEAFTLIDSMKIFEGINMNPTDEMTKKIVKFLFL